MSVEIGIQEVVAGNSIGKGNQKISRGDKYVLYLVVVVSWMHTPVKIDQIAHYTCMHFIVCQLYFNKAVKQDSQTTIHIQIEI